MVTQPLLWPKGFLSDTPLDNSFIAELSVAKVSATEGNQPDRRILKTTSNFNGLL